MRDTLSKACETSKLFITSVYHVHFVFYVYVMPYLRPAKYLHCMCSTDTNTSVKVS